MAILKEYYTYRNLAEMERAEKHMYSCLKCRGKFKERDLGCYYPTLCIPCNKKKEKLISGWLK